jgi:hypothetical protein
MIKNSPRPSPKLSASDSIDYVLIAASVAAGLIAFVYLVLV